MTKDVSTITKNIMTRFVFSLFFAYITTYKFIFRPYKYSIEFGIVYLTIILILCYLISGFIFNLHLKYLQKTLKNEIKNIVNSLIENKIKFLIYILGLISIILFVSSIYYAKLYWSINELNDYDLKGLELNNQILIGSLIFSIIYLSLNISFILFKYKKWNFIKSAFFGLGYSLIVTFFTYFIAKIVYWSLFFLMILIGVLILGIHG